ncbi:ribonuclease domain-containing protein [Fusobacterium pseudoperiodonticum]|uniref:ribonuclease domain-containing protein n=1 Tax=Fusobacterium pseudoperiodonticum TaxID=2663009 RepID=UPI00390816E3
MLPRKDANGNNITYKEFDINKADPVTNFRDNKRFVRGSDGSIYYTDDHYMTFRRIK